MVRETRQEAIAGERRRRKSDTLDKINGLKMALPPEFRDDPEYYYYWANDTEARIYDLTVDDDYEVVRTSKHEASEDDRVRRPVGQSADGKPIYAQLLRKPMRYKLEDEAEKERRLKAQEDRIVSVPANDGDGLKQSESYVATSSIRRGGFKPNVPI